MRNLAGAWNRLKRSFFALRGLDLSPFESAKDSYYAQQASCQISNLWFLYERFLGRRSQGVFVEVGAYDGVFASNSWGLAVRGWNGLLIEPVPEFARRCERVHNSRECIKVLNLAIGSVDDQMITLFVKGTLTTASEETNLEYLDVEWAKPATVEANITVKSMKLDTVLNQNNITPSFDVLMIDVEGYENKVFEGFDLDFWQPRMMIVELSDTHPDLKSSRYSHSELSNHIVSRKYRIVFKDSINTVFVRDDVWERVSLGEIESIERSSNTAFNAN